MINNVLNEIKNLKSIFNDISRAISEKGVPSSGKLKDFAGEIERIKLTGQSESGLKPEEKRIIDAIKERGYNIEEELEFTLSQIPIFNIASTVGSVAVKPMVENGEFVISSYMPSMGLEIRTNRIINAYVSLAFQDINYRKPSIVAKTEKIPLPKGKYGQSNPLSFGKIEIPNDPEYKLSSAYLYLEYINSLGAIITYSLNLGRVEGLEEWDLE